jgi:phosphatidylserine/phosphatidylglycerophosphate/cardiolipin synthase-like enzyme
MPPHQHPAILLVGSLLVAAPGVAIAWPVDLSAVCFTPGDDCTGLIVASLDGAIASIRVQAYSFTSAPIAAGLVAAHRRGVDVHVILDRSQTSQRYSVAGFLSCAGIPVLIDHAAGTAHNKVIIVDGAKVITGSCNCSKAARDAKGRQDEDSVEPATHDWTGPNRMADGSDADRVGAWPAKGLFDTKLRPNRNGRRW